MKPLERGTCPAEMAALVHSPILEKFPPDQNSEFNSHQAFAEKTTDIPSVLKYQCQHDIYAVLRETSSWTDLKWQQQTR